jgi:hypothetical protein
VLDFALPRLARCRRSLVKAALLRRLLSGVDVKEFRILNFIDRLSHRGAKSCAVTLDLAQGVVAASLRTCKDSVEALKRVDLALERLCHHVFHRQLRLPKRRGDFFLRSFLSGGPVGGKLSSRPVSLAFLVTKSVHHNANAAANRASQKPQPKNLSG